MALREFTTAREQIEFYKALRKRMWPPIPKQTINRQVKTEVPKLEIEVKRPRWTKPQISEIRFRVAGSLIPGSVAHIINFVAHHYGLSRFDLTGPDRFPKVITARYAAIWLSRTLLQISTLRIGHRFQRDHSTIIHALQRIEQRRKDDPEFKATLDELARQILGG